MSIVVKTQQELDSISVSNKSNIIIDSNGNDTILVKGERNYRSLLALGNSHVKVYGKNRIGKYDNSVIEAFDESVVIVTQPFDIDSIELNDNATILDCRSI